MASYTYEERGILLSTPIEAILSFFGKDTSHNRTYHYFSPFREESNRSFHVNPRKNVWYDFGIAEGGGALLLVAKLSSCGQEEAYDILAQMNTSFIPSYTYRSPSPVRKEPERSIIIDHVSKEFRRKSLLKYAHERGISKMTLDRFCKQITYHSVYSPNLKHTAIGFANEDGGYMLRSRSVKKCTACGISILRSNGATEVAVFEGFFDFLSWIEDQGIDSLPCNICVLNSVSNLKRAINFLNEHREIHLYLDNDRAGEEAAAQIEYFCMNEETRVVRMSHLFEGYKDYNEMLTKSRPTHKTNSYGNYITKRCSEQTEQD
jgi:DNA primase